MSQIPVDTAQIQTVEHMPVVSARAALISQSLKSIAKKARTPRSLWVSTGAASQRRWQHVFAWAIMASFGVIVILPTLVTAIYLVFFASNQYATETRFAVRGGQPNILGSLGLFGSTTAQRAQDSLIVSDYIESRSMAVALNQALNFRKIFSGDNIDSLSRLNPKDSDEELTRYWRRHVDVQIDPMSGIMTMLVRAFTPQDSLDISNKVTSLSETLVNDLTERSRQDALRQARIELMRAKENLQDKITAMRNLRNAEGVLDSGKTSDVMTQMLGDLRLELIRLEQEYSAQRSTVLPTSPQLRVLEARINSMKAQIRRFEGQMTGGAGADTHALSEAMSRFDRERLEKDIAEKEYIAAADEFEHARVDLESQQLYLATFLKPILPQEALYPRRLWLWSIIAAICLLVWGSGAGLAVFVRNHLAV